DALGAQRATLQIARGVVGVEFAEDQRGERDLVLAPLDALTNQVLAILAREVLLAAPEARQADHPVKEIASRPQRSRLGARVAQASDAESPAQVPSLVAELAAEARRVVARRGGNSGPAGLGMQVRGRVMPESPLAANECFDETSGCRSQGGGD